MKSSEKLFSTKRSREARNSAAPPMANAPPSRELSVWPPKPIPCK
jgi:hypothetical protein